MNIQSLMRNLCFLFEDSASADLGELATPFFIFLFIAVIVLAIPGAIGNALKKNKQTKGVNQYDEDPFEAGKNAQGFLTQQQIAYQNNLKQRKGQKPPQQGAHGTDHSHLGSVESYDPIVGSLGEHSDEGCDELDGVRLISTDFLYQTDDDEASYNYDAIRKGIVMGEILNTPRFKKPFGKK